MKKKISFLKLTTTNFFHVLLAKFSQFGFVRLQFGFHERQNVEFNLRTIRGSFKNTGFAQDI